MSTPLELVQTTLVLSLALVLSVLTVWVTRQQRHSPSRVTNGGASSHPFMPCGPSGLKDAGESGAVAALSSLPTARRKAPVEERARAATSHHAKARARARAWRLHNAEIAEEKPPSLSRRWIAARRPKQARAHVLPRIVSRLQPSPSTAAPPRKGSASPQGPPSLGSALVMLNAEVSTGHADYRVGNGSRLAGGTVGPPLYIGTSQSRTRTGDTCSPHWPRQPTANLPTGKSAPAATAPANRHIGSSSQSRSIHAVPPPAKHSLEEGGGETPAPSMASRTSRTEVT